MSTDAAVDVATLELLFALYLEDKQDKFAESTLHGYRIRFDGFIDWYKQEVTNSDQSGQ